jgi:hypothetical protein
MKKWKDMLEFDLVSAVNEMVMDAMIQVVFGEEIKGRKIMLKRGGRLVEKEIARAIEDEIKIHDQK